MINVRTFAIINMKGGVGKTATTTQLASILVNDYHKRVLLVDCDGQCNLTHFYLPTFSDDDGLTLANVLKRSHEPYWMENVIGVQPGLFLLPASPTLYLLDLASMQHGNSNIAALSDFVEAVAEDDEIDIVLFDCPPGYTSASTAALMAATDMIIPTDLERFGVEGTVNMMKQVESIRRTTNPRLRVSGILLTKWRKKTVVLECEKLIRSLGLPVFKTAVRYSEKLPESVTSGRPVIDYSPGSAASQDYRRVAAELFGEVDQNGKV